MCPSVIVIISNWITFYCYCLDGRRSILHRNSECQRFGVAACYGCGGLVGSGEGEGFAAVCREGRYGIAYRYRFVAGDGVGNGRIAVLCVEGRAGGGVGRCGEVNLDLLAVLKDNVACGDVSGNIIITKIYRSRDCYRISRLNIVRNIGSLPKNYPMRS